MNLVIADSYHHSKTQACNMTGMYPIDLYKGFPFSHSTGYRVIIEGRKRTLKHFIFKVFQVTEIRHELKEIQLSVRRESLDNNF